MIGSFRLHLAAEGKAARTVQGYTSAVRWFAAAHLLEQTKRTGWEQVDTHDIQQWMVELLDRYSGAYASIQFRRRLPHQPANRPAGCGRRAGADPAGQLLLERPARVRLHVRRRRDQARRAVACCWPVAAGQRADSMTCPDWMAGSVPGWTVSPLGPRSMLAR